MFLYPAVQKKWRTASRRASVVCRLLLCILLVVSASGGVCGSSLLPEMHAEWASAEAAAAAAAAANTSSSEDGGSVVAHTDNDAAVKLELTNRLLSKIRELSSRRQQEPDLLDDQQQQQQSFSNDDDTDAAYDAARVAAVDDDNNDDDDIGYRFKKDHLYTGPREALEFGKNGKYYRDLHAAQKKAWNERNVKMVRKNVLNTREAASQRNKYTTRKKRMFGIQTYFDAVYQKDGSMLLIPKDVNKNHYFIG